MRPISACARTSRLTRSSPSDRQLPSEKPPKARRAAANAGDKKPAARARRRQVKLSSPDKPLWPDIGLTKQDLLDYYATVWPLHAAPSSSTGRSAWCGRRTASKGTPSSRSMPGPACTRPSRPEGQGWRGTALYPRLRRARPRSSSSAPSRSMSGARRSTRSRRPTRSSSISIPIPACRSNACAMRR